VAAVFGVRNPSATWHTTTLTVEVDLRDVPGAVVGAAGPSVPYQIFYPSDYQALGFESPIVTWGNGTGAAPTASYFSELLDHFVSWGFTVIAADLPDVGSGVEVLDGARYLVAEDADQRSPFFGHLDVHKVAAVGFSQGAGGAVRAALAGASLITTVMTFSLPWNGQGPAHSPFSDNAAFPHGWAGANPDCPTWQACWADPGQLTQPTFLISTHGRLDSVIAPPGVERCYFEELRAPSVQGVILHSPAGSNRVADHPSIENTARGEDPTGFFGYATAWLMYQLRSDNEAAGAFTGAHPQLLADRNWPGSSVSRADGNPPRLACDDRVPAT